MADIIIQELCEDSIDGALNIERACFSTPWSREMLENELYNETARFFAAIYQGNVVGYAGMYSVCGECYIANVGVLPEYRRQGIAMSLLNTLEKQAESENAEFITLEVRESNTSAVSLYLKRGYTRVGLRKNYYSNPQESAVLMTKYL